MTANFPLPALRTTAHFVSRLHERFPEIETTESALLRELAGADWYAGGRHQFYAVLWRRGRAAVIVADYEDGLLTLVTIYPPARAWDRRLGDARPIPFELLVAAA